MAHSQGNWKLTVHALSLFLLAGLAARAEAQVSSRTTSPAPDREVADILRQIGRGEVVWITSADGMERKATIAALSATSVDLVSNGVASPVAFGTIARIDMLDPVVDGVQKGLMTGASVGASLVLVHFIGCGFDEQRNGNGCVGRRTFGTAGLGALVGGLIGWGLDGGNQKREAVYIRRSTVTMAPIFARRAAGFGAAIGWR